MDRFITRFEGSIVSRGLLPRGTAMLVGVSGGMDSMVLLHALHTLASRHKWVLTAAHFNHLLRGRAAEADQRFVARAARKLGVRFESASADVQAFAKAQKLSIEMAARTLRHEFLARAAIGLGVGTVALAHHADDQVELFLLRLLRGAGSVGLGGMHWRANSPADPKVMLVRPLLQMHKAELAAWAREQKIAFREDATNGQTDILRNRIRHKLLPLLRKDYQRGIEGVLLRESKLLRDEAEFLTKEAERWMQTHQDFVAIPAALQRRVLHLELLRAGIAPDFALIDQLCSAANEWVSVNPGLCCRRDQQGRVEKRTNSTTSFCADELRADVLESGSATFGGAELNWRIGSKTKRRQRQSCREVFDAASVGDSVILRHWRSGDRFQPSGMARPVKLQNLFTNQKIPRERRHKLIVATTLSGEVFWVEGLRIGERFKMKPSTKQQLEWKWRRG